MQRLTNRNRSRGYSLLEILIVLAIIGLIAGVTALALTKFLPEARVKTTRESGRAVRSAATLYRMEHNGEECPGVPLLKSAQLIDDAAKTSDAWDTPFAVECDERGGITVKSAGPDRRLGTTDDISVPDGTGG